MVTKIGLETDSAKISLAVENQTIRFDFWCQFS